MSLPLTTLHLLTLTCPIAALALHNTTIGLPPGSSDHGTPGLLCTPTRALDLLTFYLLNYVAHAATVLSRPGERGDDYLVAVIGSLLFPALGLYRGIEAILCGALWVRNDDLRKAARSGALCLVVRGADWRPVAGENIENAMFRRGARDGIQDVKMASSGKEDEEEKEEEKEDADSPVHIITYSPPYMFTRFGRPVFVHRRLIHGTHTLPPGYRFAILPPDAEFTCESTSPISSSSSSASCAPPTTQISAPYPTLKALIALLQSVYALSTLYRARGTQVSQFGYAAFGLSVAPYAVMSLVNLVGNVCRPEYAGLYMVRSSGMEEARRRGGVFEGVVGGVGEGRVGRGCACDCDCGDSGGCGAKEEVIEGLEETNTLWFTGPRGTSSSENGSERQSLEAHFYSPSSPIPTLSQHHHHHHQQHEDKPESSFPSASTTPTHARIQTYEVAPLPPKQNYISTQHKPLLLIPSHAPLLQTSSSSSLTHPLSPPHPPTPSSPPSPLSSLSLQRTYPFLAHYTWTLRFASSAQLRSSLRWRWTAYALTSFIALLPVLITGLMSRFQSGSIPPAESTTWRVFTMQWLCFGVVTGLWWVFDQEGKDAMASVGAQVGPCMRAVMYVTSASPAVGGYIVVGQMLYRYGVCVWVGD